MNTAAKVFMWIFSIILGLALLTILVSSIWMAFGKLDNAGIHRSIAEKIRMLTENDKVDDEYVKHVVVARKFIVWSSIVAAVSFIICFAIGVSDPGAKQAFKTIYIH